MRNIQRRSGGRSSPAARGGSALSNVILAIGRDGFCDCLSDALRQDVRHDIIGAYFIDPRSDMRVLFAEGGVPTIPEFSKIAAPRYASGFWKEDPAVRRFLAGSSDGYLGIALQRWNEIPRGEYRAFAYERPQMLERLSLFKACSGGSILLSLYRTQKSGHFSSDELGLLERQSEFLMASTIRHWELLQSHGLLRPEPEFISRQIEAWREDLSPREIEVCSALLGESSIKQAVRATSMQTSTFMTYRKRAFAKLGIRTRIELEQLYERRYLLI
jgi:DNA-binding CsgD family transcriptional regulator